MIMKPSEILVRDVILLEFKDNGGMYCHAEDTDDVTLDGRVDIDCMAVAIVEKLRNVYGLDL